MKHLSLILTFLFSFLVLNVSCSKEQEFEALVISENEEIADLEPIEEVETETETTPEEKPYHYLFTEQAKAEIKRRIEQEYVTGPGFTNDFVTIKGSVSSFLQAPDAFRPIFGEEKYVPAERQNMYQAAVYAWATEDVELTDVIIEEIYKTVKVNSFDIHFWKQTDLNFGNDYNLFIQSASIKKMKDSFYLLMDQQTVMDVDKLTYIENWFNSYKDIAASWFMSRVETYFGAKWNTNGISNFKPEGLMPGISKPIEDKNGIALEAYTVSWAQNLFNNRNLDTISFLYSWAVKNDDTNLEIACREFFKLIIKYGVFPDGTYWETIRNESIYHNATGVFYTNVSLSSLVYMAHIDAMTQHFPNDLLYDYETVEGIEFGSTTLTKAPYVGGSTSDGITLKSLKTLIIGQSKYLRTQEYGGWADIRFYNGENLNTTGKVQNSVVAALANLYYKDENLKDYYLYKTNKGYPLKKAINGGYGGFYEDYGAWGNLIAGGLWLEMESYYFN